MPDALDGAAIAQGLAGCTVGRQIVVVDTTTSTNDEVLARVAGAEEGLVVFAQEQTAGRGQRGNRWESARAKGLWLSILLRPAVSASESPRLTTWAAQTVAQVVRDQFDLDAVVKPPNVVYVGDRKIAGVLVEMRAQPHAPHVAIAGIGLNVNQANGDFPVELRARAASLSMLLGRAIDRTQLAIALLTALDQSYRAAVA